MNQTKEDIVFKQSCTGLGDSLQFSTLPERYSIEQNKDFYLHVSNAVSNEEIEKLVWLSNPYVQKLKSKKRINCTYHMHLTIEAARKYGVRNFVEWAEFSHGFEIKNSKPKIYYKPSKISELSHYSLLDLGGITVFRRGFYDLNEIVDRIKKTVDARKTIIIDSKHSQSPLYEDFKHVNKVRIRDIFHYSDLINSCDRFYCLYSGGSSLASSIREDGAFVFFPDIDRLKEINSGSHLFPNNKYYCSDKSFLNDMKEWRF